MAQQDIYELHFYPGSDTLDVILVDNGKVVATFPAKGGDPSKVGKGGHELTNTGTFIIEVIEKHRSWGRWPSSTIRWDTPVRIDMKTWRVYNKGSDKHILVIDEGDRGDFLEAYSDVDAMQAAIRNGDRTVEVPYYFNDFGHISIKMYEDKNNNGRMDTNEYLSGHFMHTTPWSEQAKREGTEDTYELGYSHGCIHVKPSHIDELISKYIVKGKTKMVIHPY